MTCSCLNAFWKSEWSLAEANDEPAVLDPDKAPLSLCCLIPSLPWLEHALREFLATHDSRATREALKSWHSHSHWLRLASKRKWLLLRRGLAKAQRRCVRWLSKCQRLLAVGTENASGRRMLLCSTGPEQTTWGGSRISKLEHASGSSSCTTRSCACLRE